MNLDHTRQLRKLVETIVRNQSFINKNSPNLKVEHESPLQPKNLEEKFNDRDEFV